MYCATAETKRPATKCGCDTTHTWEYLTFSAVTSSAFVSQGRNVRGKQEVWREEERVARVERGAMLERMAAFSRSSSTSMSSTCSGEATGKRYTKASSLSFVRRVEEERCEPKKRRSRLNESCSLGERRSAKI